MTYEEKVLKICPDAFCIYFKDSLGGLYMVHGNDTGWNELLQTGGGFSTISAEDAWEKTYTKMNNIILGILST